jgi:hypothetical protein
MWPITDFGQMIVLVFLCSIFSAQVESIATREQGMYWSWLHKALCLPCIITTYMLITTMLYSTKLNNNIFQKEINTVIVLYRMRSSHCHHLGWHGKLCAYCYLSPSKTFPIHQNISKSHPCSLTGDYLFTMLTWSKHYQHYHAQHLSYKLLYLWRIRFHHQLHRQPQSEWSLISKICPA